ncbi:unnamed protein product [Eretmochelys imbricata]
MPCASPASPSPPPSSPTWPPARPSWRPQPTPLRTEAGTHPAAIRDSMGWRQAIAPPAPASLAGRRMRQACSGGHRDPLAPGRGEAQPAFWGSLPPRVPPQELASLDNFFTVTQTMGGKQGGSQAAECTCPTVPLSARFPPNGSLLSKLCFVPNPTSRGSELRIRVGGSDCPPPSGVGVGPGIGPPTGLFNSLCLKQRGEMPHHSSAMGGSPQPALPPPHCGM